MDEKEHEVLKFIYVTEEKMKHCGKRMDRIESQVELKCTECSTRKTFCNDKFNKLEKKFLWLYIFVTISIAISLIAGLGKLGLSLLSLYLKIPV